MYMYNIAFYQKRNTHTEILGCFFEIFLKHRHILKFTLYYDNIDSFCDYVKFYTSLYKWQPSIKNCKNLLNDGKQYDWIILLTSDDNINPDVIKKYGYKIIYIVHYVPFMKQFMKNIITLSEVVKPTYNCTNLCILPIYKKYDDYTTKKQNILSIVGMSKYNSNFKDIDDLIRVLETYNNDNIPEDKRYTIHIYSRKYKPIEDQLKQYKNVIFHNFIRTNDLIENFRKSKFVLPLAKRDGYYHNKLLTGSIPIGINNNIPVVLDRKLQDYYQLDGSIVYNHSLLEVMDQILYMTDDDYTKLVKQLILQKKKISYKNENLLMNFIKK